MKQNGSTCGTATKLVIGSVEGEAMHFEALWTSPSWKGRVFLGLERASEANRHRGALGVSHVGLFGPGA